MKSVRRWREVLVYLPPAVLVVIAAQQVAVTRVEHLTPWKGGGFGMFSSIDMPTKRIVRGFLTKAGRETPISLPPGDPLERPMSQLKTLPSSGRIEEIADALARRSWSIDPKTRLASPVEREAAELRSSPGSAIRLEVYRLYFHPDTDEVERVLLTSVSRNLHE